MRGLMVPKESDESDREVEPDLLCIVDLFGAPNLGTTPSFSRNVILPDSRWLQARVVEPAGCSIDVLQTLPYRRRLVQQSLIRHKLEQRRLRQVWQGEGGRDVVGSSVEDAEVGVAEECAETVRCYDLGKLE